MSAKRQASYDIDEKTLQQKNVELSSEKQKQSEITNQKNNTNDRTILSVKKDQLQAKVEQKNVESESVQPKQLKAPDLFTGLFASNGSKKNSSDLFKTNGSGLFNTNNTSTPSTSIFGQTNSLFQNSAPSGLFTSNGPASKAMTGGLFGNNNKGDEGKLFLNFKNQGVPPVKNSSSSLFGATNNQEEDSGDSAELQAAQNTQVDPSKSKVNYQYEQTSIIIEKHRAFKFKKQNGDLIQNIQAVIQQDTKTKLYYIIARLPATKKQIYTGLIVQGKSQVNHMNKKSQNVEISAFSMIKEKLQKTILKFQFQKQQTGNQLFSTLEQIINGAYKPVEQTQRAVTQDATETKTEKKTEQQ